jgi:inorganic pyrophosphatase
MFYKKDGKIISPFHDIPWLASHEPAKTYNMVVEVPRWTNSKMEIATQEELNPIKQDTKKGKLRYVANSYPFKGYIWNYGAIPQTWENPCHEDNRTNCCGDNDPIDVCEIGSRVCNRGDIIQVKVLGVLAMIDEGETDWKVIAIDVNVPDAKEMNDINDVERLKPGYLKDTRKWFRIYKVPDGKPHNSFAFNGEFKNREYAEDVIAETHQFWKELISNNAKNDLDRSNTTVEDSPTFMSEAEAMKIVNKAPEPSAAVDVTDQKAFKWCYVEDCE